MNPFDRQSELPGIKKIIAVGAGKGGVGKSTVATNLALSLQKMGFSVGLLDADIYGPSIPRMLGVATAKPNVGSDKKIQPIIASGLKVISMGFLVEDNSAIIWRGPMLFKAMDQFLKEVDWGNLDYLIVDLPPGTGDVQLSLAQKVPIAGAVIVTTPQDVALMDVRRCVDMFQKVKTPILGVVENMSGFICPHCEKESLLFPRGELAEYCAQNSFEILGNVPFQPKIAIGGDKGLPIVSQGPSHEAEVYSGIAKLVAGKTA